MPSATRIMMERYYAAMSAEVDAHGGTVEKFIGDAVVAVFGVPRSQEDHAQRAWHVALAMRDWMAETFGGTLELRIGVNTGEVRSAPQELEARLSPAIPSSRGSAPASGRAGRDPGGERTARAAAGFEFGPTERVQGRGKPEGIPCRRLHGAEPEGQRRPTALFLGRADEIEQLQDARGRTASGRRPVLVTIVGDPGIGKTTLVNAFATYLGDRAQASRRLRGRCLSYGHGITYWALGEVLKQHFAILDSDSPAIVAEKLSVPELGWTLGIDPPTGLHPLAARDRLHQAWVAFVNGLAADELVVLEVEDLHWAEDPLLELLETLVLEVDGSLLVVATGRPELLARHWIGSDPGGGGVTLELEPFSAADGESMIAGLLHSELPVQVVTRLVDAAEGNPLFIEELVAGLVDRGTLVAGDDGWVLHGAAADVTIPDSIQAVIAARIDLLPTTEKAALQAASVIGRNFWSGPLYELLQGELPNLRLLEERRLIGRVSGTSLAGQREYAFKHALIRQVAYASLPTGVRARLHAAFAGWIEASTERDDHAALLAHHYAEAARAENADLAWTDQPETLAYLRTRAVEWLRAAAEVAVGRYSIDVGLSLLERALEFSPPREVAGEIWRTIGRAHALRYEGTPTIEAYERAAELLTDQQSRADVYGELALETITREGMLNPRPPRELVRRWIRLAVDLSRPGSRAHARGHICHATWDRAAGEEEAKTAVALAERLPEDDIELRSHAYNARLLSAFLAGRYDVSLEWGMKRLRLADRISDPDHLVDVYSMPIPGLIGLGRFEEARRYAEMHNERALRLSTHHQVHAVAMTLELEELFGGWETIRGLQHRAEEIVAANRSTPCIRNARSLGRCARDA